MFMCSGLGFRGLLQMLCFGPGGPEGSGVLSCKDQGLGFRV